MSIRHDPSPPLHWQYLHWGQDARLIEDVICHSLREKKHWETIFSSKSASKPNMTFWYLKVLLLFSYVLFDLVLWLILTKPKVRNSKIWKIEVRIGLWHLCPRWKFSFQAHCCIYKLAFLSTTYIYKNVSTCWGD